MKKVLIHIMSLSLFAQASVASGSKKIQFLCGSSDKPAYEFLVDSKGSVEENTTGIFGEQVIVDELVFKNLDVRVRLSPFHAYCFIQIEYTNHTNNVFKDSDELLFSKTATISRSCEGGPVHAMKCDVVVK